MPFLNGPLAEGLYPCLLQCTYNVLVTIQDLLKIREYTATGVPVRDIKVPIRITTIFYSSLLSDNRIVISLLAIQYEGHAVCILEKGAFLNCYTYSVWSDIIYDLNKKVLSRPGELAVDARENIMVVEDLSNRVVLLSPFLELMGYITGLSREMSIHVDDVNHVIYISEN